MKSATSELVDHVLDLVRVGHADSLRLDSQLVDGAVGERRGQRLVDAAVLLDQRQARRATARSTTTWKWSPPPVRSTTSSSVASGNALSSRPRMPVDCSRVDRTEHEPVAGRDVLRRRRPRARSRPWRPCREAIRQGRRSRTTSSTTRSRSQKTASIENRMKNMWIEPAGRKSIPSPGSSDGAAEQPLHARERGRREPAACRRSCRPAC